MPTIFKKNKKGFAAIFIIILVIAIMFGIGISAINMILGEQEISRNLVKSTQAYYAAESGIEDALLKISVFKTWTNPFDLQVGDAWVTTTISEVVGGVKLIVSEGNILDRTRKEQVVYAISTDRISFFYGAQVGDGGMVMGNGSSVSGNVFSNGNITGGGTIANDVIVAGNGNKIDGINVGGNATVHTCDNADITGTLYYVSGGSFGSCTYGSAVDNGPNEIEDEPLPISQSQIDDWKTEASTGGISPTSVTISGSQTLGPVQIGTPVAPRNLTLSNNATLTLNGTVYVTGNIITGNNSKIQLNSSYDSLSGIILADGTITVANNTILTGSGQAGSYLLVLSTNVANNAITLGNNAMGAILYTSAGGITLANNMAAREVTGYKIILGNNASVQYESGLENANFSGGTGAAWEVQGWKEIE